MQYETITTDRRLRDFCRELADCPSIAFDTEFVSEHTYRPVLCLVQVAAAGQLAILDPLAVKDMMPFWETIAAPGHETIVHAGRSEVEFCLQAVDRAPAGLFDVQLAAGLTGIEYPAGYSTLVSRVLDVPAKKHETRTDWRRRPLSQRQLDYSIEDVLHLQPLRDALHARLSKLGRIEWLAEEIGTWLAQVQHAVSEDRWRRVSGNSGLDGRSLAIVRELYHWRETEAQRRNQPARRVLRDDLIIELAKRQSADAKRIGAVRGLERGDLAKRVGQLAECIGRALNMPEQQLPRRGPRESMPQLPVLGQFLFAALGSLCRQADLAPNLVGGPGDIRELIAYRTSASRSDRPPPQLARGWRQQFVGRLFDDLLAGAIAVRVGDPESDHPLVLEPVAGGKVALEGVGSQEPGVRRRETARGGRTRGGRQKTGDRRQKSDDKPV
jgi:ribonuclease D